MNIENLTIAGPPGGLAVPTDCSATFFGILFTNASGTVNNVTVENVFQQPTTAFGSCQVGVAIRANGLAAPANTVTITNTTVTGYQKGGLIGSGAFMTMDVSNSTIGPPASLEGFIAQNGVQYGGANGGTSGTISDSTIFGSGDEGAGPGGMDNGTAVLLFTANNVTVDHNTMTGPGTNFGVSVAANSTSITISNNNITRTAPDVGNDPGHGVDVEWPTSAATLICNTFSGWSINIVGALQIGCTGFPDGVQCLAYSATGIGADGGTTPYTWSESGALPPGLEMSSATGDITGTPTQAGTFPFTVTVGDTTDPQITASRDESITISPGACLGISLVKTADASSFSRAGEKITYTFAVKNTGTQPLDNVVVSDPLAGLSTILCPSAFPLAVGRTMTCTAHYKTTSADVSRGTLDNTATATGSASGFPDVTDTSSVVIPEVAEKPSTSPGTSPSMSPASSAVPVASISPITPAAIAVTG
jgi:uncharacterized repeat protein (TIGR01451 family)